MTLREELKQLGDNTKKDAKQIYEKVKQYPLISLFFIIAVLLLIALPHWQVSGINNAIEKVTQENQSRATLAQILGGVAIGIGLYYTWRRITIAEEDLKVTQENLKVTQKNLKVSQEGQITERFTRAVEQLGAIDQSGNPAIEIRLGGIYALERISTESEKDYWPIIEILTAYVRKNSSVENQSNENFLTTGYISMDIQANESTHNEVPEVNSLSLDIEAVITVLGRSKHRYMDKESKCLNLKNTFFKWLTLKDAHFEGTNFSNAHFEGAVLKNAHFEQTDLFRVYFEHGFLIEAHFEHAIL
ncbi:pentapeptide repeat-containing protein [Methanosarcina sp. WWM596]|nr:pentapeptide repeat-containing protein [Methanosarcina sp. WWM596]